MINKQKQTRELLFAPKVDPNSKIIVAAKGTEEGVSWWETLSKPKKGKQKVEKGPPQKSDAGKEPARGPWQSLHKRVTHLYKPTQETEQFDCTFRPGLKEPPKYVKDHRKAMAKRDKMTDESGTDGDTNFASTSNDDGLLCPGGKDWRLPVNARDPRQTGRMLGAQSQALQAPYQKTPCGGLRPYSKMRQGLAENMADLQDPVFQDLHRMLHSLQL